MKNRITTEPPITSTPQNLASQPASAWICVNFSAPKPTSSASVTTTIAAFARPPNLPFQSAIAAATTRMRRNHTSMSSVVARSIE